MKINKIISNPITLVALAVILLVIGFQYENLIYRRNNNNVDSQAISPSTAIVKIEESETARLKTDGSEFKILTSTYLNTANFIFLDERGETASTLSVSNLNIETPYYSVVKGQTRDWLVVTRVETSGTGILYRVDEWYVLGWFGNMKMVLSYRSGGHIAPGLGLKNRYIETDIMNERYPDDSAVDVKFIMKYCSVTENGEDKDCSEESHITHYVWDDDSEEFVFDPKKSDISEYEILHAFTDFNPPNPPVKISWAGKIHGMLTYATPIFKNLAPDSQYQYFIAEPNDLVVDGGSRYSPTINKIKDDDIVIVSGGVRDFCFWPDGIDNTEYQGCVPYIDIDKIVIVK